MNDTVVFRSGSAGLTVGFPPNRFGFMQGADFERDTLGRVVKDPETGKPMHTLEVKPSACFGADGNPPGTLHLDPSSPDQARMIDDLKKSAGYGETFWEDSQEVTDTMALLSGKILLTVPAELTDDDRKLLDRLVRHWDKSIAPNALAGVYGDFVSALDRFKVRGLQAPPEGRARKMLLGRIRDFLDALEQAEVIKLPDSAEAKADNGDPDSATQ